MRQSSSLKCRGGMYESESRRFKIKRKKPPEDFLTRKKEDRRLVRKRDLLSSRPLSDTNVGSLQRTDLPPIKKRWLPQGGSREKCRIESNFII